MKKNGTIMKRNFCRWLMICPRFSHAAAFTMSVPALLVTIILKFSRTWMTLLQSTRF